MQYVSKLNFQSLIIINYTFLIQTYNSQTIISIFLYVTITISKRNLFTNFYINIKLIISFYSFQKSIFLPVLVFLVSQFFLLLLFPKIPSLTSMSGITLQTLQILEMMMTRPSFVMRFRRFLGTMRSEIERFLPKRLRQPSHATCAGLHLILYDRARLL